jgi:hypothetical protein
MAGSVEPLVVQYLYVHEQGEAFYYPTTRSDTSAQSSSSAARVAVRYLECALTQAASLTLQDARCELALVTNLSSPETLGKKGVQLWSSLERLGVKILPTEYHHRSGASSEDYVSSRYVLDAILAACEGQPAERMLWLTDLDCVWASPDLVFAHAPEPTEVGCVYIDYPPDWDAVGFQAPGISRRQLGRIAADMGGADELPPWVGGELLCGTPETLRSLVSACDELDRELAGRVGSLPTEEQVLTLAGTTGRVRFRDLSEVARRMTTGPRSHAKIVENPLAIGLWHLPSEKGLSLRRAALAVEDGRTEDLRRDLAEPARAARRFNVAGTGLLRRVQDDSWIARQRLHSAIRSALPSR